MARKANTTYQRIVLGVAGLLLLVLGILAGIGWERRTAPFTPDVCAARMTTVGAPAPFTLFVCYGHLAEQAKAPAPGLAA